jgi:hypothetical protein
MIALWVLYIHYQTNRDIRVYHLSSLHMAHGIWHICSICVQFTPELLHIYHLTSVYIYHLVSLHVAYVYNLRLYIYVYVVWQVFTWHIYKVCIPTHTSLHFRHTLDWIGAYLHVYFTYSRLAITYTSPLIDHSLLYLSSLPIFYLLVQFTNFLLTHL